MVSYKIRRGTNKEKMSLNIILKKAAWATTYNIRLRGQTYQGALMSSLDKCPENYLNPIKLVFSANL